MTREQHLAWCRERAHEYVEIGQIQQAITSMMSDLQKHDETMGLTLEQAKHGMEVMMAGDREQARRFIDSFR